MNYIAVRGQGDPNEKDSAYKKAISILYAIAYTIKMSYKGTHIIDGFFEYVVPPLEGFWQQSYNDIISFSDKSSFNWISVIRLPALSHVRRQGSAECLFLHKADGGSRKFL